MTALYAESAPFYLMPKEKLRIDLVLRPIRSELLGCLLDGRCRPIKGAEVYLHNCATQFKTCTDKNGFFVFQNIEFGYYLLSIPAYCVEKRVALFRKNKSVLIQLGEKDGRCWV